MIKEWALVTVHKGLEDPKAVTLEFFDTEESAHAHRPGTVSYDDTADVVRFSELPDKIQHRAASLAILDLQGRFVKYVPGTGGKTQSSVWVEYEDGDLEHLLEEEK